MRGVKLLKEDNQQDRVVSNSEFTAYIMAAGQPLRDIAKLVYHCGMRPAEVYALRIEDIDLVGQRIVIRTGKTKSARRRLTFSSELYEMLSDRCEHSPNGLLFAGGKSGNEMQPVQKVTNAHNGAVSRAGLRPFRLYDLRHTFATEFLAAGGDLVTLAAVLGHSRLEMVMRYAHPTEPHQAESMRKLEEYRKGGSNVIPIRRNA